MTNLIVPILFIIFNRPDMVKRVFEEIRKAKPLKLYIYADGPRVNVELDKLMCQKCRDIVNSVDWQCEVFTNYQRTNLGCGKGPASALNWIFRNEDRAIILEDDCLPDPTFFPFCQDLLEKYSNDTRIVSITGQNLQSKSMCNNSYYFSRIFDGIGWATWGRVWSLYDYDIKTWPILESMDIFGSFFDDKETNFFLKNVMQQVYEKNITSAWDYQFWILSLGNNGLNIHPSTNLISHIGIIGTHSKESDYSNDLNSITGRKVNNMKFPLKHPDLIVENRILDNFQFKTYLPKSKKERIKINLKRLLYWL